MRSFLWLASVEPGVPTREEYLHISGPEKVAFYVLMAVSVAILLAQVIRRIALWRSGKPPTWKPDPIGSIAKYVLGQRKVQSSRPKSGAPMHLMIFYGFMALFLATTLLAISSYGYLVGLPRFHQGNYYLLYEATFDALGLLFLVGIVWAGIRRAALIEAERQNPEAKVNPNPLSHRPSDWAVLGLLFVLGLTGYILEAARIAVNPKPWDHYSFVGWTLAAVVPASFGPEGYKAIWWFHAFLVAVLFATLPLMRIKHIVTATLAVAGAKTDPNMGRLVPIRMEEVEETGQIGVNDTKQFTSWHLMSLDACMECGRCTEVCPAHNVGKVLNPKRVVQDTLGAHLAGGSEVIERVTEEALWECTTCNACVEACPVLIKHVDMIVDMRRNLVAEGKLSGSGATLLRQLGSTGNAWGAQSSQREDWMKGLDIPLCRDGKPFEYLFWVGCAGATDPLGMKTTKAFAALLRKANVSFACLGSEESCTGDPARRLGDEFTFQASAEMNLAAFKKYGVKKVVTACPHCLNTLRNEYGDFGDELEVFHHTELLSELVGQGLLRGAQPAAGHVTYHDPCYLARVNNTSDPPRSLVGDDTDFDKNGPALLDEAARPPYPLRVLAEPKQHARKTLCCGAGGGRMWMDEEPDQRPSSRRLDQLVETGAETIAVACPFCRIMLDAGMKQRSDADHIRLVDLAEMMQEANAE
ncbi:MAG: (Fe-S)-binding protein [Fimbriimonadaceae bacterium]|nr:(Fe-S)-binding protein [Fimbriimonadaceae bacterium]